ncbi:hypothetical protein Tco_0910518 [Tanacetum coccineum]|uniref:Retrovirus-related Pol polyprotein from transposon TNT 1-94 n=1 Tax=Tanacetum coccineum TaxID=301880 RepID=A0ABQ5CVD1_9ASTR
MIRRIAGDCQRVKAMLSELVRLLETKGMQSCDLVGTPMEIKDKSDLDQNGSPVDTTKYHSMIGALMYLTSSRPDIVHATCLCARYQAKPTEKHLKEDSGFELTSFSDADYAGCKETFKSTSGEAQFLGKKLTQLTDYGFHFNKIPIYCDSKSAIAISCNLVQHSRTKHIVVRYHFIKEHVEKGMIELYFVKTDYQLDDLFTKVLLVDRFNYLVRRLGMRSLSPQELNRLAKSQNTPLDRVEVLGMIEKRSKVRKGIMQTEMELVLEQTQQGTSYEVSFLQYILDLYFKHFKLSEDVVNRILQVILDLQHFKSSLLIFAATILQISSATLFSHSLWSSQSFGHQKAINGFDMPLPVAVCSGLVNPLAPRKGTDNQEKDEKQSQNDKTGLGMEKTVKDKAKSKPESQSSQKVNRKVNWSKSKSTPGPKFKKYKFRG